MIGEAIYVGDKICVLLYGWFVNRGASWDELSTFRQVLFTTY